MNFDHDLIHNPHIFTDQIHILLQNRKCIKYNLYIEAGFFYAAHLYTYMHYRK